MVKKSSDRQAYMKENYKQLKAAGFSTAEATRLRNASREKVEEAIRTRTAPQIDVKRQAAKKGKLKKIKYEETIFKNKTVNRTVEFELNNKKDMERTVQAARKFQKEGFNYFFLTITFFYKDGTYQDFQTPMIPVSEIENTEYLENLISETVGDFESKYGTDVPIIDILISVKFWKANVA